MGVNAILYHKGPRRFRTLERWRYTLYIMYCYRGRKMGHAVLLLQRCFTAIAAMCEPSIEYMCAHGLLRLFHYLFIFYPEFDDEFKIGCSYLLLELQ